jgi:hypothetical protein
MPRYFFHLEDSVGGLDGEGVELDDLEAAKHAAVLLIAGILHDHPAQVWASGGYGLTCADERGLALFSLAIVANLAPAARVQAAS